MEHISSTRSLLASFYFGSRTTYRLRITEREWLDYVQTHASNYYQFRAYSKGNLSIVFRSYEDDTITVNAIKEYWNGRSSTMSCALSYQKESDTTIFLQLHLGRDIFLLLVTAVLCVMFIVPSLKNSIDTSDFRAIIFTVVSSTVLLSIMILSNSRVDSVDLIEGWLTHIEQQAGTTASTKDIR
ncbi:MAG: hypothetical protein JNL32_11375 [Candidatus Kapabacteria bacterium]|nr:hypothetical protein [Candidatus Kapabacteria bacterium]